MSQEVLEGRIIHLTKIQTGLPFDVLRDGHQNYFAVYDNGLMKKLSVSDIINIHLLVEIKTFSKD